MLSYLGIFILVIIIFNFICTILDFKIFKLFDLSLIVETEKHGAGVELFILDEKNVIFVG
ncbi:MAG: hypothetical protein MASP_01234 [Candidatus Methanolliviera sp. GoM_asphalt]|nr:MAG: hypothetical protein MASP_01234 [Candidatus Methanolliviera sp. GoM_asphalt]